MYEDTAAPINATGGGGAAPKTRRYCRGALNHDFTLVEEAALQGQPEPRASGYQAVHVDEARVPDN